MKPYLFLLLLNCLAFTTFAQSQKIKLTETSVVKDSDGTIYPFLVWRNLASKGEYEIRPIEKNNENTEFLLVKLNEEQKMERLARMPKPRESEYFITGREFAPFKTRDINNNKIDLREYKGKVVVLNFWFINCPPCRMEIPDLNQIESTFSNRDSVKFIGVALDSKYDLKDFLKSLPFNYDIVENGSFLTNRYGVRSYPTHVILDQEGRIYFHTTGLAINTAYWIKKSISELLDKNSVAQK